MPERGKMKLWYDRPAQYWHEALPIGNGRMGGMVYGGTPEEIIQLNEDSIWSGKHLDRINPDARENLSVIRKLIREGRGKDAEQLAMYALSGIPKSERSYQTAGELYIKMHHGEDAADYRRELDLETGIASVTYTVGGVRYLRSLYVSYPDQCIVMELKTEEDIPFSFDCLLGRCRNATDEAGKLDDNSIGFIVDGGKDGISFAVALSVKATGGRVSVIGEYLLAREVKRAYVYLDIETSFRNADYRQCCLDRINAVASQKEMEVRSAHVQDFGTLFGRLHLSFDLTKKEMEKLPTDKRLKLVQAGELDMGLIELYFQYGRYLLISSSRIGSLPANLQGIWNDKLYPAWESKFTININTEMNYWIAGSGNLSECQMPLFELLERIKENGRETAKRMYGCRGSVAHHNTDLYGDTAPQDHTITSTFWVMGEAWLATHIWEQYLYTGDEIFLQEHFDVLEQCVLFFYDFLIEGRDGTLVTSPSISPENTYRRKDGTLGVLCESAAMDTEILMELFSCYINACKILCLEPERITKAKEMMARFPKLSIGKYGQLMEWMEDYEEPEPGHRHISHLYGVYPGSSISYEKTKKLMDAAKVSLERRLANGGGHTGWSRAWIIALWTHFKEGRKAFENLQALLTMGTYPNLMDNHPLGEDGHVFQIDGNLGASAAVLEMLAYSRPDRLELLPAITRETAGGSLSGMRLRSGGTISMEWKDGKVIWYRILPERDSNIKILVNGQEEQVQLRAGVECSWRMLR